MGTISRGKVNSLVANDFEGTTQVVGHEGIPWTNKINVEPFAHRGPVPLK